MPVADVLTQADRLLVLETPLEGDTMLITSFTGYEAISGLFRYDVEMVAERASAASVKPEDLIGQRMTIHVSLTSEYIESPRRKVNGIVNRFVQRHADKRFVHYRAELVPWLWLLTQTADCRIFQDKSTLEIIEAVFGEFKGRFADLVAWRNATTKTYTKLDYCVQYRESAFNFVCRLMEQDGIFFYFEHSDDKHTLVLADAPTVHKPCPDQSTVVYVPEGGEADAENMVMSWDIKSELRPGKYTLRDYHMQMPTKTLEVEEPTRISVGGNAPLEVYDYPGEYARRFNKKERQGEVESEATKLVKLRMEEEETPHEEISGDSLCRGFIPGFNFKLTEHFNKKANAKYVLTSVHHTAVQTPSYVTDDDDLSVDEPYRNTFTCIPESVPYRPSRRTPKPLVQGTQTAIVVGPPGEEIWTDEFGRVKVQFPWDRHGKNDDKSSCWVRVSQPWAGKAWGAVAIPRIGQEVVIDFLEGDPDQPLINGRLYNADLMPPYTLPDKGMVCGCKSNSTPGGGGYNEISLDDTKGTEKIVIHGQYDMEKTIEHDDAETIHNNRTIWVGGTHTEEIKGDTTITVTEGKETVTVNKEIEVTSETQHIYITADTEIKLEVGQSKLVMKKDGTITLTGKDITIDASSAVDIMAMNITATGDVSHAISAPNVKSEASITNTLKGTMVLINS